MWKSDVKASAIHALHSTPSIAPAKAVTPLRLKPAARKMTAAVRIDTAATAIHTGSCPFRHSGTTKRHTTRQQKPKESSALTPTTPPKITSSSAKSAKSIHV